VKRILIYFVIRQVAKIFLSLLPKEWKIKKENGRNWRSYLLVLMLTPWSSSILTVCGNGNQTLHEIYQCRMDSGKLMMMGKGGARNM
jgi:hypothetical protein